MTEVRFSAAPLEGITTFVYRNTHHALFGGAERYFFPFYSPTAEHRFTTKEQRDLDPANNRFPGLIPQVLVRRPDDFIWALEQLRDMGYPEVNLNLGCPSGTVTAKGKGSGLLARMDELEELLDRTFEADILPVSVKTRIGVRDPEEFGKILELYNRYPIRELTIHPRVQKEFYKGAIHEDVFAWALKESRCPVCYSGDLVSVADCQGLEKKYPGVPAAMVGRGLVADPALLRKLQGGPAATREELDTFVQTLYHTYCQVYGQKGPAAQRMKQIWIFMIHLFQGGEKQAKAMRRLRHHDEYERVEREIFATLELRQGVEEPLM